MQAQRQVKRLRLKAATEAEARHASLLLEDALNTASLPALLSRGLLLIRHLDLGRLPRFSTATELSLHVERHLRSIQPDLLQVGSAEAPYARAVWFANRSEAGAALSRQLLDGPQPRAWYWQRLFPSWHTGLTPKDALRVIALDLAGEKEGLPACVRLLEALGDDAALLLDGLSRSDGERLSALASVPVPRLDPAVSPPRLLCTAAGVPAMGFVAHWIACWGATDRRSHWLLAVCRVAEGGAVTSGAIGSMLRSLTDSNYALSNQPPVKEDQHAIRRDSDIAAAQFGDQTDGANRAPTRPVDPYNARNPGQKREAAPPVRLPAERNADIARPVDSSSNSKGKAMPEIAPVSGYQRTNAEGAPPVQFPLETKADLARPIGSCSESMRKASQPSDPVPAGQRAMDEELQAPWGKASHLHGSPGNFPLGDHSAWAGLPLLIRLFQNLGLDQVLEEQPALADADLPGHLLRSCAQRLGIQEEHPVVAFLPPAEEQPDPTLGFRPPPPWGAGCPSLRGISTIRRAWIWMGARFLHRHCRMTLSELINRPGHIAITRTHLDLSFSLRQVDIRLRRAGLDFDPGWVPWLNRVVCIHYLEGDVYE